VIQRAPGVVIAARYRLVRQLGFGGMGTVWLAHDLLLDSTCALKLIDDDKAQSEEVRVRFAREAKVAAQLRGSHVVDVFEHSEWEGIPFIVMEFLDGEDLGTRLDRLGKLDAETTYRVIAHVARALSRAHSVGIVHRDLKPDNIFLIPGDDGEIAKVLDFGIAKHDAYSLRDKATKTGSFLGTPFYVSPEQARGKDTDHRSDLWSLGVIAFQCLTGAPPFESEALGELMGLILYEDLPMPSARNSALPPALDAWWKRAAAREREERFQSARELADALGQALGIEKMLPVAALPINRTSFADIQLQALIDPRGTPPRAASSPALEELMGGHYETGAPLTHTRISSIPFWTKVRSVATVAKSPRRWPQLARAVPRRQLAAAGVLGGIALGVMITAMLAGGDPAAPTAVAASIAEPVGTPLPPRPEVIPTGIPKSDLGSGDTPATDAKSVANTVTSPQPVPSASASSLVAAAEAALGTVSKAEPSKPQATKAVTATRPESSASKSSSAKRKTPSAKKSQKRDYGI
jgi:serine/threonine protein kinase